MSQFDNREKAFENKFALDEETRFKVMARMGYLFGLWAAEQMGMKGAEAETYAKAVVHADMEKVGHDDLIDKVEGDFKAKKINITRHRMEREVEACYVKAREMVGK